MHMLMMHVTLLLRHKSSFSYLPPLLTRSAIVTTHTVSPRLLLFHLLQNTERQKLPVSVWPESSCFSVFSRARCYGQRFLAFWGQKCFSSSCHSESLSVEWCLRAPQMQHCSCLTTFLSLLKILLFISLHSPNRCQKRVQSFSSLKTGTRGT